MKSLKFFFSLLLTTTMLSVAMPAMAQEESAEVVTEAVAEVEAAVEAVVGT